MLATMHEQKQSHPALKRRDAAEMGSGAKSALTRSSTEPPAHPHSRCVRQQPRAHASPSWRGLTAASTLEDTPQPPGPHASASVG